MSDQECEIGVVESITDDKAVINLSQSDICKSCHARLLCRPDSSGKRQITALNRLDAQPGQKVTIEESGNLLLIISMMQFGLPLFLLLVGIFIADGFKLSFFETPPEIAMSVCGLIGLLAGGAIARIWAVQKANSATTVFEITTICPD